MSAVAPVDPALRADLPPFAALRAFEAIGRCGGIRRAAAFLSVDHTVISRHLRALESWLGVTLYDRRRNTALTPLGERYFARISLAMQELEAATEELQNAGGPTSLRIYSVPGFGVNWLAGRLPEFLAKFPSVELEFKPSPEGPDFLRQEADIDIRFAGDIERLHLPKSVRAIEIGRAGGYIVASPDYLARIAPIDTVRDLLGCTLLHEENTDQWVRALARRGVAVEGELKGPKLWSASATLAAARAGEGLALTNDFLICDDLKSGRLVKVRPDLFSSRPGTGGAYWLIVPDTRWLHLPVQQFRHWISDAMARHIADVTRDAEALPGLAAQV